LTNHFIQESAMNTIETGLVDNISFAAAKNSSLKIADVLKIAKLTDQEATGLRELSIAELGRVGGGAVVGTTN
jgi:hypothetical protein